MKLTYNSLLGLLLLLITGCAGAAPLKGMTKDHQKVYLGPVPIEKTIPYQNYLKSAKSDLDKQRYLFQRLQEAHDLQFLHDGNWYNALEAYRGGMWLMRNRYKKGQNTRTFIQKYVERSEAGNLHLVKYPNGSLHIGSYVLYNELDILEQTSKS